MLCRGAVESRAQAQAASHAQANAAPTSAKLISARRLAPRLDRRPCAERLPDELRRRRGRAGHYADSRRKRRPGRRQILLEQWVRTHGIPQALYCDWKKRPTSVGRTSREEIEGVEPETQFRTHVREAGHAHHRRFVAASQRAAWSATTATHQDRLIKKMRLAGIADYEAANRYLDEHYLDEHNAKFGREPAAGAKLSPASIEALGLEVGVFVWKLNGWYRNDFVVRFEKPLFAVEAEAQSGPGSGRASASAAGAGWRTASCHRSTGGAL